MPIGQSQKSTSHYSKRIMVLFLRLTNFAFLFLLGFANASAFSGTDLVRQSQNIPYGSERDQFILNQLSKVSHFDSKEVRSLVELAARTGLEIILTALPKTSELNSQNLVQIVEGLHLGTDKDKALIFGAQHIKNADVASIKLAINQAYKEKIQVMSLLVVKLPKFSTVNLALLAKGIADGKLRDQILSIGSQYLTSFDIDGLAEMVGLADLEKNQIALSVLSRIKLLTASHLGLVLKMIDDGAARDKLIADALPLVKKVDGIGAGSIIERSVENKFNLAMLLLKRISKANGTDLDQLLDGVTLGIIRDQILNEAVPRLGSLTKEEAKALHRRAYNNKDNLALLLMTKVEDFDGVTIAEIARLSLKSSARDLIIAEGLKRLKEVDPVGLIAMIGVADKLLEILVLEVVARIPNYSTEMVLQIFDAVPSDSLKDRFLIRSVDLVEELDEPTITVLAMAGRTPEARAEIVRRGVQRIEDSQ